MGDVVDVGRLSARRFWSDRITKGVIGLGGGSVIVAITLIFAYLLWVVSPLLLPGTIEQGRTFTVVDREPLLVDISENGEQLIRFSRDGVVEVYDTETGRPQAAFNLGMTITHARRVYPMVDLYAVLDKRRQLSFVQTQFIVGFDSGQRIVTPRITLPFPGSTLALGDADLLDVSLFESDLSVLIATIDGALLHHQYREVEIGYALSAPRSNTIEPNRETHKAFMGPRNQWVYHFDPGGKVELFDRTGRSMGQSTMTNLPEDYAVMPVLGRYSIIAAHNDGLHQWGVFKKPTGQQMEDMRSFPTNARIIQLVSEPRRKGFASLDETGRVSLHYPTTGQTIDSLQSDFDAPVIAAISPRSDLLLTAPGAGTLQSFGLNNKHPEISFTTLWRKVWYEGYDEPIYSWQSSSADNDFEPKFSLTPLAFGTLKAAFYALFFAVPIAIMGAIYTAYFMSPAMRAWVKPGIEIMAALPTVILGFIGGLWLAPIIESYLSSVLSIIVVLPALLFGFALLWASLPDKKTRAFEGWYGLLVTPIIVATVYGAFGIGPFLEEQLFGGDSKAWFREVMGLSYDQRNALVVGVIMGLAVIPAIFSIAEDAIYGVPTHLINGSLALGATPWQTLTRVVLLTASPGIFSAVMIGMGRAVGETMIVLMATGNTPLMDFNIFEGMRTFAANIAVELPEAEVDSSHYRILFLAALVLFMLTFMFNTLAEIVRQRLRAKYGSL